MTLLKLLSVFTKSKRFKKPDDSVAKEKTFKKTYELRKFQTTPNKVNTYFYLCLAKAIVNIEFNKQLKSYRHVVQ